MEKCLEDSKALEWHDYFCDLIKDPETPMPLQNQLIQLSEVVFSKTRSHVEIVDIARGKSGHPEKSRAQPHKPKEAFLNPSFGAKRISHPWKSRNTEHVSCEYMPWA